MAARSPKAPAAPAPVDLVPHAKLTVDALERYLWSAADILRGSIDSSDYKRVCAWFSRGFRKETRARQGSPSAAYRRYARED